MSASNRFGQALALVVFVLCVPFGLEAQRGGGGRGGFGAAANLPDEPVAVALPAITGPVTGPGTPYESVQSLPPGRDLAFYGYEVEEYFVSGTADGAPYETRIMVRRPADDDDFSGLVIVEPMHSSGSAHIFEYTSDYTMDSGHIAVDIVTAGFQSLTGHNEARYADMSVSGGQTTEMLAQIGALLRGGGDSPLDGLGVRRMVLGGTSQSSGVVVNYMAAHDVYRTPSMGPVYDGYLAHSNGSTIQGANAPLIQVPTMNEVRTAGVPTRQDSDEEGSQYRLYEFAGMGHVDSRDSVRTQPDPCANPVSQFPLQAYLAVAVHHLIQWTDQGVPPPRGNRVLLDRNTDNDDSLMALDVHGNPIGGIRNPYVDVPVVHYGVPNSGAAQLPPNPSEYMATAGLGGARQICGLGVYQEAFSPEKLRELYGTSREYVRQVEARLNELEAAGWSLPVYHDVIMSDARSVEF